MVSLTRTVNEYGNNDGSLNNEWPVTKVITEGKQAHVDLCTTRVAYGGATLMFDGRLLL